MPKLPALDPQDVELIATTGYPPPFDNATEGRAKRRLTDPLGLTRMGVNITEIAPDAKTSIRHWHSHEDEFVMVLEGEVTLVTDAGEQVLSAGMCAGFPAGVADGHCIVNTSGAPAKILEVGTRDMEDEAAYPDVDLHCQPGRYVTPVFTKKDGTPIG